MINARRIVLAALIIGICYLFLGSAVSRAEDYKNKAEELAAKIAREKLAGDQEIASAVIDAGYFEKAEALYKQREYEDALDAFLQAREMSSTNKDIEDYINKCEKAITKASLKHYFDGVKLYKQSKLIEAMDEFSMVNEKSNKYAKAKIYIDKIEEELEVSDSKRGKDDFEREKEDLKGQLKDLKEQLAIAQLRKEVQEQQLMLDVDKAYLPSSKVKRAEATQEETVDEKKEREDAEARAKVIEEMKKISVPALSLNDADIRDVIRQLMNMTGVTIVLDEVALNKVAGEGAVKVTFTTVTPIPLLALLELSLKTTGLNYRVEPTYIWISDRETLAKEELVTKTYKLKYGVRKMREVSLTEFGTGGTSKREEY
ncbi:MAG: hypothetical protein ABH836_08625 [Candidatus Omnitrophota bacterium]